MIEIKYIGQDSVILWKGGESLNKTFKPARGEYDQNGDLHTYPATQIEVDESDLEWYLATGLFVQIESGE